MRTKTFATRVHISADKRQVCYEDCERRDEYLNLMRGSIMM